MENQASTFLPILAYAGVMIGFVVTNLVLTQLIGPRRNTVVKNMPYESGMIPLGDTRARFSVKFYLVAVLFILFDIEVVFLYPWAVAFRQLGLYGLIEMALFIVILFVGYVYLLRAKALEWD